MGKGTVTLLLNHTTDAGFQAWGQQFKTFWTTTLGLTQTADTGQANWATAVRPAINTYGPYEIYRLNDTAQATAPMFMKVRYGTAGVADRAACVFDIGEGSDGAGNLTGATWIGLQLFIESGSNASTTLDVVGNWNSTNGYFGFFTANATVIAPLTMTTFSAERLRTITGAPSTRGFTIPSYTGLNGIWHRLLTPGAFSSEVVNTLPLFWPVRTQGASSAGGTFVSGLTPLTGNGTFGPLEKTLGFCGVGAGDFAAGAEFSVTRWDGASHIYKTTATYGSANMNANGQESNCRHAIWWD